MFDEFWNSLDIDDVELLDYVTKLAYTDTNKLTSVISKLDMMLSSDSQLIPYDSAIVVNIRQLMLTGDYSLTSKGVDFLNGINLDS